MTGALIYVKHNLPFIWSSIEWINSLLFKFLFKSRFEKEMSKQLISHQLESYNFRALKHSDIGLLQNLMESQSKDRLKYFKPHAFNKQAFSKQFKNQALIMFGVFHGTAMVGYFFLRCFINKQCFVGRLVDEAYSNQGIGKTMNKIMYKTGWNCEFRVLSTISKDNNLVLQSHRNNKQLHFIKELPQNFLMVEFKE